MYVWYASYGSNLATERFACYLGGGRPEGATRTCPGARDATPPLDERAVTLPGRIRFGGQSTTWGGGVAFLDADAPDRALARAYLITEGQFADVAAQEMHRDPSEDLDLGTVLEQGRHSVGPGRYETLHLVGELEAAPVLTFTAADPDELPVNPPSTAYLRMIARGLRETHDLGPADVAGYLLGCDGVEAAGLDPVAGGWSEPELAALAAAA